LVNLENQTGTKAKQVHIFTKATTTKISPIEIARQVGNSLAGRIGAEAFIELELAYATRLLPRFADDSIIRKNQNLLCYWQFGYYKSTILRVFSQTIPDDLPVVDITSMTLEKIFGSIDEKKRHIIEPAFTHDVKFVIISELSAVLGQREGMRQFVNVMNAVLENEKVTRQMLKLGHGTISDDELETLESKGVHYDPIKAELSYTPNVCVFAATRPLDNRYFTHLHKSGHFSRYHLIQRHISDEEASQHLYRDFKLDQKALDQLKEVNLQLSRIDVNKVLRPSEELMKPIFADQEALVRDEITQRPSLKLADVLSPRIKGDIIREFVGHAFLRSAYQNGFRNIDELCYTQADVDFIRSRLWHFVDFAINPIIAESVTPVQKKQSKTEICENAFMKFLEDGEWHEFKDMIALVEQWFKDRDMHVSHAVIYNARKNLERQGKIECKHGKLRKKEGR